MIYIVSGMPRSGTSMMMNILQEAGIEVITNMDVKNEFNPNGFFEYRGMLDETMNNPDFLKRSQGKALKIVADIIYIARQFVLPPEHDYRVIYMDRDDRESIISWHRKAGEDILYTQKELDERIVIRRAVLDWMDSQPNIKYIIINYKDMLNNPVKQIKRIKRFLKIKLNIEKGANVVNPDFNKVRL